MMYFEIINIEDRHTEFLTENKEAFKLMLENAARINDEGELTFNHHVCEIRIDNQTIPYQKITTNIKREADNHD